MKTIIVILMLLQISCTKYHTREFIIQSQIHLNDNFVIAPRLFAFSGSSRVSMKKDIQFGFFLQIQYKDKHQTDKYISQIDSLFIVDSVLIESPNLVVRNTVLPDSSCYKVKKYFLNGKIYYFKDHMIEIPNDISIINITVYYHEKKGLLNFNKISNISMIRHESSSWGPIME